MNITHLQHALWAATISCIAIQLAFVIPPVYLLCFAGALFFFGREHAHAELKIMDKKEGITLAVTLAALAFWKWDKDTLLDFLFPVGVSVLLCIVISLLI